ncbi:MAG: hypothetical protein ABSH38_02625 [Verrucomicrobiota bacterium]|jgi:ABC-type transport system involved in multi-copper enzyme maturation permease subunit
MTFLPIVERELRLAARRKSTFAIRGAVALLASVIGGLFLLFSALDSRSAHQAGAMVFITLSWYTLILSLLAGVFLASDCLSEERREGTLGFLFLTDLKGYDVVLGKFAAVALNAFYGLLAVLPVLSLCLLAGGVTGAEFWRMCLALVNTLFFSVALAIWVSANCQSAYRAMSATIALLVAFLALTGIASALASVMTLFSTALFYVGAVSPVAAFLRAPDAGFSHQAGVFWTSLGVSHLAGWTFLGLASWRLKFFTETARSSGVWQRVLTRNILAGKSARRSELLEINPVLWLLDDSRRLRWVAWGVALAGAVALILVASKSWEMASIGSLFLAWPFYFLLKLFFAVQACRFFSEARRTGSLELLCCTPITMKTMIRGQWLALRRLFMWPVIVLIVAQLLCVGVSLFFFASAHRRIPVFNAAWFPLLTLLQIVPDFFALGWFGMWSALSFRKPGTAAGLTILYVLILPRILSCIPMLSLVTDAIFIGVGCSKLQEDFRRRPVDWSASR